MRNILLLMTGAALMALPSDPAVDLEAAIRREVVQGDLKGAAETYRKIAAGAGKNREVAARALLRLAMVYRKQGDAQARQALERVVKEYADQRQLADQARQLLAALPVAANSGTIRTRLVWDNALDLWGTASSDGRYYSYVDWTTCDLAIRDLVTGENRKLTNKGCGQRPAAAEVEGSSVSPDGKRIAFTYAHYRPKRNGELYVIGADGAGEKLLMSGGGLEYVDPYGWSPDGKWISAFGYYGSEYVLLLVSPDSGEVRRLPLQGNGWPNNASFSPDGRWLAYSTDSRPSPPVLRVRAVTGDASAEHLLQANARMMAWTPDGAGILFSRQRGETNDLYFLEVKDGQATGAPAPIYAATDTGGAPAGITSQGVLLYEIRNRQSETLVLPWNGTMLDPQSAIASVRATNDVNWRLVQTAAHFSNDGKQLFTVSPDDSFVIRDMQSGRERIVKPRMQRALTARWAHDDRSLLVRGTGLDGKPGLYRMDPESGVAVLLAELPEGTWGFAISRDGRTLFHGMPAKTMARDLATGAEKTLFGPLSLGNYNLVVSRDGNRLAIRSSESLAVVDLRTGQGKKIFEASDDFDGKLWGLDWSADDTKLHATVRVGINGPSELWTFSPEGGPPTRQKNPASGAYGLSISPDGKYAATTNTTQRWQLWALENFLPAKR